MLEDDKRTNLHSAAINLLINRYNNIAVTLIGGSVSEPHTSLFNCDFFFNWGKPERDPLLWIKRKIVYIYDYIYVRYVRIPYMHSALFVSDAIFPHVIHVKDIVKLATFESQKEVVCMIHLWNPKKGEKGGVETKETGIVALL